VQGVDQAKKELVINELEKEEAQTFLPILIFLAYIYARIFVVPLSEIIGEGLCSRYIADSNTTGLSVVNDHVTKFNGH